MTDYGNPTLNRANEIRIRRARYLKQVKGGRIDPAKAALTCTEGIGVVALFRQVPWIGAHRAAVMLASIGVDELVILGEPTPKQAINGLRGATPVERQRMAHCLTDFLNRNGSVAA